MLANSRWCLSLKSGAVDVTRHESAASFEAFDLNSGGVETFESCQGGAGHAMPDPTIKFHRSAWAGYAEFAVAMEHDLPVLHVRRATVSVEDSLRVRGGK